MNYLTAREIAETLNIEINYDSERIKQSEENYIYHLITKATGFTKAELQEMTDLELAYFIDGSTQNFVNLQKETVLH